MTKILLAEDHPIVTEGIKSVLNQANYEVVGVVTTIDECEQQLSELKPDLLLLDIGMPFRGPVDEGRISNTNALDYLPDWKRLYPQMRTLILSCYGEPSVIRRAMDSGADGYVLKDSPTERLLEGIRAVVGGGAYFCPAAKAALMTDTSRRQEPLTQREREILRLITEGLSMKQIADQLCLSFETVHSYTKFIRAKLGVNNTAALVRKALEQRLV